MSYEDRMELAAEAIVKSIKANRLDLATKLVKRGNISFYTVLDNIVNLNPDKETLDTVLKLFDVQGFDDYDYIVQATLPVTDEYYLKYYSAINPDTLMLGGAYDNDALVMRDALDQGAINVEDAINISLERHDDPFTIEWLEGLSPSNDIYEYKDQVRQFKRNYKIPYRERVVAYTNIE